MTARPLLLEILASSPKAKGIIDERVAETSAALAELGVLPAPVSDERLAAACLGDPISAVGRLVAAGVLPDGLTEDQRAALASRLSVDKSRLTAHTILSNVASVAVFLGMPGFHGDRVPALPSTATPAYGLFAHQRAAVRRAQSLLRSGKTRLLLHMPTGSGKTRTTMSMICDILREQEGRAVLWFASTRELLDQAAREFDKAWSVLGNREIPVLTAWGGQDWNHANVSDGLIIASLQTIHARQAEPGFLAGLGQRLSLIVFDEAHQAIAPTYRSVVQRLAIAGQPITPLLGLSATPGRTFAGSQSDQELADFFERTKVELETTVDGEQISPVDYLIREGYLAQPEFRLLGDLPEDDDDLVVDSTDETELGMDQNDYLREVSTAVLDLIKQSHTRIIVFAASVELAHVIAAILRSAGVLADAVDGATSTEIRDTVIRQYKAPARVPRVLVNYGVLTTGFDAPKTSAVVIARPTRSLVLYSQMVGRGIRGPRAGGNARAVIVTVIDPSVPAFGSIASAFTHWEDLW